MNRTLSYIAERKKELRADIETDHKIGADPYDNVARWKEVVMVEKVMKKELERLHRRTGTSNEARG